MDALKQQLLKVQQQLAGLTASQKMLTASLLVIMVMTLFYWSRIASVSEMEAVLERDISTTELADMTAAVAQQGVPYEVRAGRLYVPAGRKAQVQQAISNLALNNKLPVAYNDAADDAEDKSANFLDPPSVREQRLQARRGRRVEAIIRGFPGVKNVSVVLTGEKRTGILNADKPTASVAIVFEGGPSETKRIVAAARLQVSHVQSGLAADDVGITVNGRAYKSDGDGGAPASDDMLAYRSAYEQHYINNILSQFNDIVGLKVTVSVNQTVDTTANYEHKVDPKAKVEAQLSQTTSSDEKTASVPAGEAGLVPNVGVGDSAASTPQSSTSEKSETKNLADLGYKNQWVQGTVGNAVPQTVAVRVPESYYRKTWKFQNPKATGEPSEADLKPLVDREEALIRTGVKNTTGLTDDKLVSVATYVDFDSTPAVDASATVVATLPVNTGFGAKEIAIGALALISLFMVSMMVRKSVPQPVLATVGPAPAAESSVGPGMLSVQDLAGEVSEAHLTLTGQELSEEAIEAKQVIEQVGTMVKANPDVAASLVKRWLNQD